MLEDRPNRDIIERAENLIVRLREVQSCRIYADESGAITEIHVVAVTDRAPKLLARDVETCLKASLGLTVDYRKIGVVVIDPEKNTIAKLKPEAGAASAEVPSPAADEGDFPVIDLEELVDAKFDEPPDRRAKPSADSPGFAFPPDERLAPRDEKRPGDDSPSEATAHPPRIAFKGLRVAIEDEKVDVEVRLARGALVVTGSQGDYRFGGRLLPTIAGAALHAISELLDEDIHLCLAGLEEVVLGGRIGLCAVVNAIRDRSVTSYIGCAFIGTERNECAVLAVLDALNRPLGEWNLRSEIHYTIR
jgi:hypothetical protein